MSAPPQARASVRGRLRRATAAAHTRLHRLPAFTALAQGVIGREDYRELLGRLLGFHAPFDELLQQDATATALAALGVTALPRRGERLRHDLGRLGTDAAAVAALPCCAELEAGWRRDPGLPWLLGALYVREGSGLGGAVLAARLAAVQPALPTTFLAGADGDAAAWTSLCAALERHGEPGPLAAVLDGACAAFATFERWFAVREAA